MSWFSVRSVERWLTPCFGKLTLKKSPDREQNLLASLPHHIRGPFLYLKGEDHYVRVVTERGEFLVLMRLQDAIARLKGNDGVKIHRSYWVAQRAFKSSSRTAHRRWLTLGDGTKLPVSKLGYRNIVDAGWLEPKVDVPGLATLTRSAMFSAKLKTDHRFARLGFGGLTLAGFIGAVFWLNISSGMQDIGYQQSVELGQNSNTQLAHELLQQGKAALHQDTKVGYLAAIVSFKKALDFEPSLTSARENLALAYYKGASRNWFGARGAGHTRVIRLAYEHAGYLKDRHEMGTSHVEALFDARNGKYEKAVSIAQKAFDSQPDDVLVQLTLAASLTSNGEAGKAVDLLRDTLRNDPGYPASALWEMGFALFSMEKYEHAALFFERALIRSPDLDPVPLIAAYGYMGKKRRAGPLLQVAQSRLPPGYSVSARILARRARHYKEQDVARLMAGLRLAGVS